MPCAKRPRTLSRCSRRSVSRGHSYRPLGTFQQSTISVHGSNPDGESQYQVDGMNIDAAVGATGNVTMYYDPFMFEEINYQTSNGSAETARGGIVYNMITKTGTNVLRGAYMAD